MIPADSDADLRAALAYKAGKIAEQAVIVAWLREESTSFEIEDKPNSHSLAILECARRIEENEHILGSTGDRS